MPLILIKSLPFLQERDISSIIEGLSKDVSSHAGVDIRHFTVTWEYLKPGHYAVSGESREFQPMNGHPILVDVLAPDFNSCGNKDVILSSIASSLSDRADIPRNNIFISYNQAHSGMVYDAGEIVRW